MSTTRLSGPIRTAPARARRWSMTLTLILALGACGGGSGQTAVGSTPDPGPSQPDSRYPTLTGAMPLVIAHRGASGYWPEHTLEAYRQAIAMGADFIEVDLAATRDGHLVSRHEPTLSMTTDVASRAEFADRRTTRIIDGVSHTDWFTVDFTLAELATLRARQARPGRDISHDGQFSIPTLDEVLALAAAEGQARGREVGVYIETKHPGWHRNLGLAIEERLLDSLAARALTKADSPVIIQSFERDSLRYLRSRTAARLMLLIAASSSSQPAMPPSPPTGQPRVAAESGEPRADPGRLSPLRLAEIKVFADGIGPWKAYVLPTQRVDRDADGRWDDLNGDGVADDRDRVLMAPTNVVRDAHAAGLFVHVYTFRSEADALAADFGADPLAEYRAVYALGVDGVFSDFPDHALRARDAD